MFFVLSFHVVCKVSKFKRKLLAQASCTELALPNSSLHSIVLVAAASAVDSHLRGSSLLSYNCILKCDIAK